MEIINEQKMYIYHSSPVLLYSVTGVGRKVIFSLFLLSFYCSYYIIRSAFFFLLIKTNSFKKKKKNYIVYSASRDGEKTEKTTEPYTRYIHYLTAPAGVSISFVLFNLQLLLVKMFFFFFSSAQLLILF